MKTKHHHNLANWIIVVILLAVAGGLVGWWLIDKDNKNKAIDNYNDCAAAGYAILETYPEQCKTDDGRSFTRDITDELNRNKYTSNKGVELIVNSPAKNETVTSPFVVVGQVPGNWSFEGTFRVELKKKNDSSLTSKSVQLSGEWMTEDLVPFDVAVNYGGYTGEATLVLHKDNPSGLPSNDDTVVIPLTLK